MTYSKDSVLARYARWDGVGHPFAVVERSVSRLPGRGELLVRVDMATVCGSDLHTVTGRRDSFVPAVLGHEQVGTVVGVGEGGVVCVDGTAVVPGMRVVWSVVSSCGTCDRCGRGLPQKCRRLRKYGHEPLLAEAPLTGGFASHCVVLPGTAVVTVPEGVPDAVASPASCATATVAAALVAAGALEGRQVLVTGAGMLGLTAVAMATTAGARVVAADPDPARREQALAFGAVRVVDGSVPDADADVALEFSGRSSAVQVCLDSLDVGGTAVLVGSVSPGEPVGVDPERVVRGLHTVVGVHNYRPADLQRAVDFLAAHHHSFPFAGLVEGRYALGEVGAAFEAARRGGAPRQAVAPGHSLPV
ncbi:zinc-binding dehydrogenase [Streptomyces anulatus]|uniref:zinc-binding dehydrogenase n=1 Tax=Streptomyces anulatus TaxID=1892 RepID=UPI002E2F9CB7|nr:zinc-binding dehydrogenase [Streptomyces anulatus]